MFKKLSLELGGKNATIVLDDAPLDDIMDGLVRASFTNSGQVCLCGSRVLVDASIYESFKSKLLDAVENITVGDPSDESTGMGSVISRDHRNKVESYIRLAEEEGGRILVGGTSADAPVEGVPERRLPSANGHRRVEPHFSHGNGGDFWTGGDPSSLPQPG